MKTKIYGLYRHWRDGDLYVVVALGLESTNGRERKPVVSYVSLGHGSLNHRDEGQFHELVDPNGEPASDYGVLFGIRRGTPRFRLLEGDELQRASRFPRSE